MTASIRVVRAYLVQDQDGRTLDRLTSVILLQDEWRALTKPQRREMEFIASSSALFDTVVRRRLCDRGLAVAGSPATFGYYRLTTFGEAVLAYRPDRTEGGQP